MGETKYTPGPWKLLTKRDYHKVFKVTCKNKIVAAIYVQYENSRDNAKLIAAAPELLEVLDLIVGSMSLERIERFDLLEKAKTAIKKATE